MTSGNLADLKRLLLDAHSRRIVVTRQFQHCVSVRDRAYQAHWFGVRFPRYPLLRHRVPALENRLADAQAELETKADELSGCYARLTFDLDDQVQAAWQKLRDAHASLSRSRAIWDITSSIANDRVKSRSIAWQSVERKPISLSAVRSGGEIISVQYDAFRLGNANGESLDFYPGVCMIRGGINDFALIDVMEIEVEFVPTRFLEEENVPSDATVVSRTWKKTNVDGSRDRRFAENYEIPIALYGKLFIKSTSGINEAYMFSSATAASEFAEAFASFKRAIKNMPPRPEGDGTDGSITRLGDDAASQEFAVVIPEPPALASINWKPITAVALIIIGATIAAGIYALYRDGRLTVGSHTPTTQVSPPAASVIRPVPSATQPQSASGAATQRLLDAPIKTPSSAVAQAMPTVTVKTAANMRTGPNQSAAIVRTAAVGEKFAVFGRNSGWVQVGTDKPLGWIAASLLSE